MCTKILFIFALLNGILGEVSTEEQKIISLTKEDVLNDEHNNKDQDAFGKTIISNPARQYFPNSAQAPPVDRQYFGNSVFSPSVGAGYGYLPPPPSVYPVYPGYQSYQSHPYGGLGPGYSFQPYRPPYYSPNYVQHYDYLYGNRQVQG